ncbi:MAG TPA: hypothetical protein PKW30_05805, partial [Campylobacterales bacterium]|nr:hypothetical protein [Campylobacterales bacterium]
TEKAKNLVSALDNTSPTTLLQKLFTGVTPEEKSKYENGIWKIAQSLGFDDAKIDEQTKNLYFSKAGEDYQVSGEFLDDAWGALKASSGEIVSGVGGGMVGEAMYQIAKKSKNPLLKAVVAGSKFARPAMIAAGSAAGSSTGAVSDYLYNTYKTGGEVDTDTLINKAVESGMLSAAFDMAIPVAKAAAKPAINAATAVKEFALNENLTGAKQIIKENGYSKADIDKITADISKYQTAKVAQDGVDAQRDALLSVAYQDPILHKHITSAVAEDPEKAKKLLDIVSSRAQNILEQGKEIDRDALKNSIKEYEARVSADFGDTIKLYEDMLPHYKFEVKNEIEGIVAKLKDGIGDTDIKSELDALLVRMGRTEDMGVGDMLKMRQDINSILRKPKVKRYDDIGALKTINETIDKSVDDAIDKQMIDDEVKASVKKQFSDINAEYAQMKELQDGYLYKKVFDENLPSENDFQKLLYKVSQTEIDGANRLIEKLNPQMQADM